MFTNAMEGYTSVTTGIIQTEKLSLEDQNNNLEARSERVIERAEDFRDRLIEKYAKFEAQVSAAQTILAQIQAILNINNKDN